MKIISKQDNSTKYSLLKSVISNLNSFIIPLVTSFLVNVAIGICVFPLHSWYGASNLYGYYSLTYIVLNILREFLIPSFTYGLISLVISYLLYKRMVKTKLKLEKRTTLNIDETIKRFIVSLIVPICLIVFCSIVLKDVVKDTFGDVTPIVVLWKRGWIIPVLSILSICASFPKDFRCLLTYKYILNKEIDSKIENLDKEKTEVLNHLDSKYINKCKLIYDTKYYIQYLNLKVNELLDFNKNTFALKGSILKESNDCVFVWEKHFDYIKLLNNDEKTIDFEQQIKNIKSHYKINDLDELYSCIYKKFKTSYSLDYMCDEIHCISKIIGCESRYADILVSKGFLDLIKTRDSVISDFMEYIKDRVNYLEVSYKNAKIGTDGETRVNEELKKYDDEIINIPNKIIDLSEFDYLKDKHVMECDNIIISPYGVFILETKNKGSMSTVKKDGGTYSKYSLTIEPEGRWVNVYPNGKKVVWSENPIDQNRMHILNIRRIINKVLEKEIGDDGYINVQGIIVIANEELHVENKSNNLVCRVNKIYDYVTSNDKPILTKQEMLKIKNILDNIGEGQGCNRYESLDVEKEIINLDKQLEEYLNLHENMHNLSTMVFDFSLYKQELEIINKEFSDKESEIKKEILE